MIGTGLFVNTALLAHDVGPYGALTYLLVGIILLPLIFTFAQLLAVHEGGTFFDFAATLHPLAGFIACFSYFVAKMGSCALAIHVFVTFIQQVFPSLLAFPALVLDCCLIALFVIFNMFNIRTGQKIQYGFLALKFTPIIFVIISGICYFKGVHISLSSMPIFSLVGSIPFVLYAFTGFEACCSISRHIVNAQKNAPRALLIAYSLGVLIVVLYQALFYAALGPALETVPSFAGVFPALLAVVFPIVTALSSFFSFMLPIGIASSSLGAAYGIMYSNAWNLYRIALEKGVPGSQYLVTFNRNNVPYLIVIVEGILACIYELLSCGNQVPLQQINSFGMTLTYTFSAVAFLWYCKQHNKNIWLPLLGCISCGILMIGFIKNVAKYGPTPILLFSTVVIAGSVYFIFSRKYAQQS
jgi:amino acid transporter